MVAPPLRENTQSIATITSEALINIGRFIRSARRASSGTNGSYGSPAYTRLASPDERTLGPWLRLVSLVSAIRWEAQFKLAKFCMRASIAISDLGVFLVEPVLARSKALNDAGIPFQEDAPT